MESSSWYGRDRYGPVVVVVLSVLSIDRSIEINQTKIPKIPKRNGMYVCIYAVVAAAAIIIVIIVLLLGGSSRRCGVRGLGYGSVVSVVSSKPVRKSRNEKYVCMYAVVVVAAAAANRWCCWYCRVNRNR